MFKSITILTLAAMFCMLNAANFAEGTIKFEFDLSKQSNEETTKLWIPYPVSNEDQLIENIKVTGDYINSGVYTDQEFATPMLYAEWNKGSDSRKLEFSFDVKRNEVLKRDLPNAEVKWNIKDFSKFLQPSKMVPIDGEVKVLADKITKGKTSVLDKAKAIYDWTCENTYRDPETNGCGEGDICALLKNPDGKCADIHSVFVGLLRASNIPSREVLGIRQGKKEVQDVTKWQHCWAEFYLPGYGWVPTDPGDVRKLMLKQKLELGDEGTKKLRKYFWGGIDPFRVAFNHGRDIVLNPKQDGKPLNYMMYPYAEIGSKVVNHLDPDNFKYKITYTK